MLARTGFIFFALAVPTLAVPHSGMVDNGKVRDVGVVYTSTHFKDSPKFVFELKDKPECLPLDVNVMSIQICKEDVVCVFYTGSSCNPGKNNYAVAIACGDVAEVKTPKGNHFGRYRCGNVKDVGAGNYTVKTEAHKASKREGAVMGQ